ncbi:hypothetical protein B5E60_09095 [Alistipes sp. An116]|uniref:SusC/RagA family TonB-linked outer membrane protein n=1 Tax=Alistipes sp. An116 TaxID=1965546 RepID=UPI000B379097|nr:TonB-dependent receptor [Alistipes sp. An116]OUQ53019.1 hypothetical protein B5E60_09095 [Alistipes sp. An116]
MQKTFTRQICRLVGSLALILSFSTGVRAQEASPQRDITGSVKSLSGDAMAGVTVMVKGTTIGTTTGANGVFSLKVPTDARALTVSFVGYVTREVALSAQKTVYTVILEEDVVSMDEVVVIGYGSVAKRDLTGSVASVSGRSLADSPVSNMAQALTGRMPGVQITTTDGSPDADVKIRVRGGGSITQDNSPLYIVDGFPVERISDISVNDIQSIDVLKDASSSAIYGARGANGVIIITTKSARAGRTTVSYNAFAQMKYVPKMIDVMDPYEYVLMQYELTTLKGGQDAESFESHFGTPADFDIYRQMPGRDTQSEMYGRTAWGQSHNVSVSGGTNKTRFTLSATHLDEDGVLLESGYRRTNLNFKMNQDLFKGLRLDLSAYYTNTVIDGAGTTVNSSTEIKNAVSYRPTIGKAERGQGASEADIAWVDENIEAQSQLYDPVELIKQDYKRQRRNELNVNGALTWKFARNFTWRSDFGILTRDYETKRYYGPLTYTSRQAGSQPVALITTQSMPRWRTSHTLTFDIKNFRRKHNINIMLGFEAMRETSTLREMKSYQLPTNMAIDDIFANMAFGSQEYPYTFEDTPVAMASFFGRINYSYRNKYLVTATVRADGSSKFAPGNQWGVFPSAAFAWRISEEPFLKKVEWIDDLKLRLSYGEAGNNRIANDMWRRTFKGVFSGQQNMVAGIGGKPNIYLTNASTVLVNEDLVWETTATRNLGVDFGILKNRLSGSVELYWNTTRDLLIKNKIPLHTGYDEQQVNVGQTSNRGLEISLTGVLVDRSDFQLSASFNIAFNRNRVDKLYGAEEKFYDSGWNNTDLRDYLLREGDPVGLIYGYVTDGFYTVDDYEDGPGWVLKPGVANSQNVTGSNGNPGSYPRVGSLKLKKTTPYDPNDPESCIVTEADRTVIGNANPKHTGGFSITAAFKGFDLSAMFNWVYGNSIYNAQRLFNTSTGKYQWYNLRSEMDSHHRFRVFDDAGNDLRNDKEALRAFNAGATIWSPVYQYTILHSWAVEDGSFLRLSNLTFGYTLPQHLTKKICLSKCRIYVTGTNLFCWTAYTGFDPEVDTRRSTPLTPGVDYSAYPRTRSFAVGVNLTF